MENLDLSVPDPEFLRSGWGGGGEGGNPKAKVGAPTYCLAILNYSRKLHKNERKWTWGGGGGAPWYLPKTGQCLGSVDVERVVGLNINIYIQCSRGVILSFIFRTAE